MKRKPATLNYQHLLITTVKQKYFNLVLGMIVSLILSSAIYKLLLQNVSLKIAFTLPKVNVSKPDAKPSKKQPSAKQAQPERYTVQLGDSLSIVAQKVYGDLNAWPRILDANNLVSPDLIEVGMVLVIPR